MATSQEAGVTVELDPFDPAAVIAGEAKRPTVERDDPDDVSALDELTRAERTGTLSTERAEAADAPQDGETDEEAAARAEARRGRRRDARHRKSAAEERADRLESELANMRQFVEYAAPRLQHFEQLSVQAQTGGAEQAWRQAQAAYQQALTDGATAEQLVAIDERRMEARDNLRDAKMRAAQVQNRPAAQTPQQNQQVSRATQDFLSRNRWMGSNQYAEESAIVTGIDQTLAKERRDVGSDAYIAELERRAARRLPELFSDDERDDRRPNRPTHQGSARAGGAPGNPNRVVLPAALIENARAAGLDLTDKKLVQKLAADYVRSTGKGR